MNVAIFVRVSKKAQEYDRQVNDLTEYARAKGYNVVAVIAEKVSGSKDNASRKGITELLKLARSGKIKKVLLDQVTRLGRKSSESGKIVDELTDLKISIYTKHFNIETLDECGKKNPLSMFIFGMLKEVAQYDLEVYSHNIKSGQELARKKGKIIGRPSGKTGTDKLLKNPKYKKVVKLLKENHSIRNISKMAEVSSPTVQKIKKLVSNSITTY